MCITLGAFVQPSFHWKSNKVTHSESVFLALVIQHSMHMRQNVICGLTDSTIFLHIIPLSNAILGKKAIKQTICALFFSTIIVRNITLNKKKSTRYCYKLDVCLSVHRCICVEKKNQLDVTECFTALMIC